MRSLNRISSPNEVEINNLNFTEKMQVWYLALLKLDFYNIPPSNEKTYFNHRRCGIYRLASG